jgi:uncharacterized protein (DUF2141 family)
LKSDSSLGPVDPRAFKRIAFVWKLALAIGFTLAPCIARSQPTAQPDEIRIVVNGVRNQKGSVICSLWSSANSAEFTTVGTAFRRISVPIEGSKGVCEFKGLPAGPYAATRFMTKTATAN